MLTVAANLCPAALLIYEGFDGYTGTMAGKTPNANTIGLNQGTAYNGNGVGNFSITSGLTFGPNLATRGGAVSVPTAVSVLAGSVSLASSYTGTLYNSYLVNITSKGSLDGNGILSRISNDSSNTGEHFLAFADARSGANNFNAGVAYGATATSASTGLATGANYIVISRFTNVGASGGGTATLYALTQAQFNNFVTNGSTESYLDSTSIGTGNANISVRVSDTIATGTFSLSTGRFAQFVSVGDVAVLDELRYGSTLADVIPIPEPSPMAMLATAFGFLAWHRTRRKMRLGIQWQ